MAIQNIVNDVKTRVDSASKPYSEAFKAYVDVQKKAFGVVTDSAQTLAKTEADAAKDVFQAARASFDKAREDGVKQIASQPQAYVPDSRERIVSAYNDTVDQLRKTGNELNDVVSKGYQTVVNKLIGKPAPKKSSGAQKSTGSTAKKSTASKSGSTAKKASGSKSTASKSAASKSTASKATASKSSTASKSASSSSASTSKASSGKASTSSASTSGSTSS